MRRVYQLGLFTLIFFLANFGAAALSDSVKTESRLQTEFQQECAEDNQEAPSCSAASSPLFDTAENKATTPHPSPDPSSASQDAGNASKGGS